MDKKDMILMSSSKSDLWGTPQDFFDKLNDKYHFTLDVCAESWNAKCERYLTEEDDGLTYSWKNEIVFCNPPYSKSKYWIEKAATEKNCLSVLLLPARTDVIVFHKYLYNKPNVMIEFIKGRLKFTCNDAKVKINSAPFPSMIVIIDNR